MSVRTKRRVVGAVLGAVVSVFSVGLLFGCSSADTAKKSTLSPSNPVQIELWTYYNGTQQKAFDDLIQEFNDTKGKEIGVVAAHASQGGVNELAAAVTDSAQGLVGSSEMPDAFLSYSDTAYVIDQMGMVADIAPYFTDEEKASYVEEFLAEGDLDGNGSIKVLPVAKSTETFQINLTDWEPFAAETGYSLDDLRTVEGITAAAESYYEWTDAKTPDVADDGRPFFGRDAMANYMMTGSRELGHDVLTISDGAAEATLDKATMRTLWDNYYVPFVSGYFSDEGRFRSDAVKTGDLICFVGSSTSVVYFPTEVTADDSTSYPIEMGALPAPVFEKGVAPCAPQQGAGFVVSKADERTEEACVEFLKWFTANEQNTSFAVESGYVPVTKEALTHENIEAIAKEIDPEPLNYLISLPSTLETIEAGIYTNAPFENGVEAREVLEATLSSKASADRAAVVAAMSEGTSRADALAVYLTDENFEAWFASLNSELQTILNS